MRCIALLVLTIFAVAPAAVHADDETNALTAKAFELWKEVQAIRAPMQAKQLELNMEKSFAKTAEARLNDVPRSPLQIQQGLQVTAQLEARADCLERLLTDLAVVNPEERRARAHAYAQRHVTLEMESWQLRIREMTELKPLQEKQRVDWQKFQRSIEAFIKTPDDAWKSSRRRIGVNNLGIVFCSWVDDDNRSIANLRIQLDRLDISTPPDNLPTLADKYQIVRETSGYSIDVRAGHFVVHFSASAKRTPAEIRQGIFAFLNLDELAAIRVAKSVDGAAHLDDVNGLTARAFAMWDETQSILSPIQVKLARIDAEKGLAKYAEEMLMKPPLSPRQLSRYAESVADSRRDVENAKRLREVTNIKDPAKRRAAALEYARRHDDLENERNQRFADYVSQIMPIVERQRATWTSFAAALEQYCRMPDDSWKVARRRTYGSPDDGAVVFQWLDENDRHLAKASIQLDQREVMPTPKHVPLLDGKYEIVQEATEYHIQVQIGHFVVQFQSHVRKSKDEISEAIGSFLDLDGLAAIRAAEPSTE